MGKLCHMTAKAMMNVCNKPFLQWLVENLIKLNIPVYLSSGKHTTDIHEYFDNPYWKSLEVQTVIENSPLGTGGAIRFCVNFIQTKYLIVLNADTVLSGLRLKDALVYHDSSQSAITQVLSVISNQNPGRILVDDGVVVETFENKSFAQTMYTDQYSSTGVYIMEREFVIANFPEAKTSFELNLLPKFIKERNVGAWIDSITVTDFGTPERYRGLNFTKSQLRNLFQ